MKMMGLLITALLAVALIISLGSMIDAPNFSKLSDLKLSLGNLGFNQISPSQVGQTPILFAPTGQQLLHGSSIGSHVKPKLMTGNWSSSMKQSQINQMFAVLSHGVGNQNAP